MSQFPYEKRFLHYLRYERILEANTCADICRDVADLFNYLRNFNNFYRENPDLSNLTESDIRDYLNMLQVNRNIQNSTYNKYLTHLNVYFTFLFNERLSTSMPTLPLKGLKRPKNSSVPLTWQDDLPELLNNQDLSYYTRLMLLLVSHYYTITEILQSGFYQVLETEKFSDVEQKFLTEFYEYIAPLQARQKTKDLFLKKCVNLSDPRLTLPGLHKFLKTDQEKTYLALMPRKLYQMAIFNSLLHDQKLNDQQLCEKLHLDLTSLNYYRQESLDYDFSILSATGEKNKQ